MASVALPFHTLNDHQLLLVIYQQNTHMEELIMAQIDRLEALIKSEVGEALATMQQRVDDALAAADASDTERAAVEAEFETFQGRVDNLGDRIEAEGLFGQEDEDEPGAGEPAPEPEPDNDDDTPTTEPPNDPGAVTF